MVRSPGRLSPPPTINHRRSAPVAAAPTNRPINHMRGLLPCLRQAAMVMLATKCILLKEVFKGEVRVTTAPGRHACYGCTCGSCTVLQQVAPCRTKLPHALGHMQVRNSSDQHTTLEAKALEQATHGLAASARLVRRHLPYALVALDVVVVVGVSNDVAGRGIVAGNHLRTGGGRRPACRGPVSLIIAHVLLTCRSDGAGRHSRGLEGWLAHRLSPSQERIHLCTRMNKLRSCGAGERVFLPAASGARYCGPSEGRGRDHSLTLQLLPMATPQPTRLVPIHTT